MSKKVAVIGAGLSGLVTIKELLEEGHDVVCFEKNNDIGGVFSDIGSYDSVELTVSNYFMAYSDFMPYDDTVRFWTRAEYKDYLDRYATHFDILKHINFNCLVKQIKKTADGFDIIVTKSDESVSIHHVDNIAICSGQFQKPNIPDIKGLETFPGPIVHSSDYKNPKLCEEIFLGKKVLCLGMGESAADIVTEISEMAKSTVLSLRRYHVFSKKLVKNKIPIDVMQCRYWHSIPARNKASKVRNIWHHALQSKYQPDKLIAKHIIDAPDEPGSVVTKTERIFQAVAKGMEVDIGGIKEISGSTVVFNSGRKEEFDSILFCTGFKFYLPFLDAEFQFEDIKDCYLQVFHPTFGDKIAFIGFVRPQQGGIPLMSELQARYYALILSEKKSLPENLPELAEQDKKIWEQEFYETPNVFALVNGLRYNEKIADLIGCRPPKPSLIASPHKFLVYWFHHVWPCQFRLIGPGARESAQEKWLLAPTVSYNSQAPMMFKVIKNVYIILRMFVFWIQSQLSHDEKMKWRPIFPVHR